MAAINLKNDNYKDGHYPVFLGQQLGIYDSVNVTYPSMFDLYKKQKAQDWAEDEVDLDQSRKDFATCSQNNFDVMIKTVSFQWENDSLAKSIITLFSPFLTNNEACAMMMKQSEVELLHALTYSEIVRQCVKDPNKVIDEIIKNQNIFNRMGIVEEVLSELEVAGHKYALGMLTVEGDGDYMRCLLLEGMVALIALEGIQFMSSFSATFALAEQGLFIGAAKLIQKIMLDEMLHVQMDYAIIDSLLKDPGWAKAYEVVKPRLKQILDTVVQQERDWGAYLFSEGRVVVGLNANLMEQWVYYNCAPIYRRLKIEADFKAPKQNPTPWMDHWTDPDKTQAAAQEIQLTNYKLNSMKQDFTDEDQFDF